jgi:hypothetical protein
METLQMQKYKFQIPKKANNRNFFSNELESNSLVFFHITPKKNFLNICNKGFLSANTLGKEDKICFSPLMTVSYAKNSSTCLTHRGQNSVRDWVIFVVKFKTLCSNNIKKIMINPSGIHVDNEAIQPKILGYCIVPKTYVHKIIIVSLPRSRARRGNAVRPCWRSV